MWRLHYFMHLMKEKKGIGVVEVILIYGADWACHYF